MKRNGITLIEVGVVIFIVVILMALLIPAVTTPREVVRRNQCSTHLKNLSLSAIQYEDANDQFPGWVADFGAFDVEGPLSDLFDPTVDAATLVKHRKIGTWAVSLLPWLDAQPTYEHWTEDRYPIVGGEKRKEGLTTGRAGEGYTMLAAPNLAIFQCPNNQTPISKNGANSYIANTEIFNSRLVARMPGDLDGTQMTSIDPPVRLEDFKDGSGNTVLFSESLHALPWHRSGFSDQEDLVFTEDPEEVFYPEFSRLTNGLIWHEVDWENGGQAQSIHRINGPVPGGDRFAVVITPQNAADLARPSSAHADGVNAAMADGGTRYFMDSIDMKVWHALLTPAGREPISPDAF